MLHIIACCKWVIDEAYVKRGRGEEVDFSSVDWKISDYDRHGLEEAVRIKEALGGKVNVLTVGGERATKGIKDMLSRGADEGFLVADDVFNDLDPAGTAFLIASTIETRLKPFDLILFGEGSSDLYARQVGPRVAAQLGIPCLTAVRNLTIKDRQVEAERVLEREIEIVRAPLPAAVTVLPEINVPRIPGVKDTLMAAKKPVVTLKAGDFPSLPNTSLETVKIKAASVERECLLVENTPEGMLKLLEGLRKRGFLL